MFAAEEKTSLQGACAPLLQFDASCHELLLLFELLVNGSLIVYEPSVANPAGTNIVNNKLVEIWKLLYCSCVKQQAS